MTVYTLPTLTQIKQWDVRHLTEAAAHWSQTADLWEHSFRDVWHATPRPGDTHGDGKAAATSDLTSHDLARVHGCAEALRLAARIAKTGAESLFDVQQLTLYAIDNACASALIVCEDLSVTCLYPPTCAARAADHAEDIRHLAANLIALDQDIAVRLQNAAHGINGGLPYLSQGCTQPLPRRSNTA